jgi:hypothetical protein
VADAMELLDHHEYDNQSNSGPGWSFSSATKPSTDTELYVTTLPTGLPSAWGCR